MSDSDDADSEVRRLTALSFHSLSCPDERYLHTHRAWDTAAPRLVPSGDGHKAGTNRTILRAADFKCHTEEDVAFVPPKATPAQNLSDESGREHFECVDVDLENYGPKKDLSKKTVPKRKILLKRREKSEKKAYPAVPAPARPSVELKDKEQEQHLQKSESGLNGYAVATKEPEGKESFLRAVSLDEATHNSRFASCHVKDVLSRKMQSERSLRSEQPLPKDVLLAQSSGHGKNSEMHTDNETRSPGKPERDCSSKALTRNSSKKSSSKCVFPNTSSFFKQYSGVSPRDNALTNTRKQNRKYLNNEKVGQLRNLPPTRANCLQWNSGETKIEAEEKREEHQTDAKPEPITQQLNCKPLSATAIMNRLKPGPTKRTANQYRKVLSRDEKREDSSENDLPSVNVFTSKTPQIKLMPQANSEQKNNTFSICRVINLQRKSDAEAKTLSATKHKILSPTAPSSANLFCDSDATISKPSFSDSWQATEDINKPKSQMCHTRDISKLKKESYSGGTEKPTSSTDQTSDNQETTITKASDSSHLSLAPSFIQCRAICQKDISQNMASLHEKQNFDNVDSGDESKGPQFPVQDEKSPQQRSRRMNAHTTDVHGIEYASLNSSPLDNVTPSYARDSINVLCENKDPVEQTQTEVVNQSKISHITIQRTLNIGEKVVLKESHLNFRVNSKPAQCLNNPEFYHSVAEQNLATEAKQDLKSSCLTQANSFDCSTVPARGSQDISDTSSGHNKETDGTTWNSPNDGVTHEPNIAPWTSCDSFTDINTDSSLQKHVFADTNAATPQEIRQAILSPLHSEHENRPLSPNLPRVNSEQVHHQFNSAEKSTVPVNLETGTNASANDKIQLVREHNANKNKVCETIQKHDNLAHLFAELDPQYTVPPNIFQGYKKEAKSPSGSSVVSSNSVQARHLDMNPELLRKVQNSDEDTSSPAQPGNAPYFTIPFQEQKSVETRSSASTLPQSSTASGASSTASSISNFSFFTQGDSDLSQSGTPGKDPHEILQEKTLLSEPFENVKPNQKHPQTLPGKSAAHSAPVSDESIQCNRGVSCRGMPCVHHPQMQRKMLIDPDSGKCYYIEPPRNPHLKMLYDPETGQYVEVLIPPLPVPPHAGFYQAPFPPMVLSSDCYGSSYLQYPGFPGFSPPLTVPHVHPDHLQNQQHRHEHQVTSANYTHIPKQEVHVNQPDNPLERMYYIPTGMTSSPTPSQSLLSQASCCSPIMVDKGHFYKVPLHQTHNKTNS
ncbi:hypothetical protein NDU88_006006 [Pleurodeles waltl]|uniref:DUF4585 domain-containing protein n=1 Tax=Pleurodeles waltl TaxID=8319 RepID=A0AAV7PQ74_PLEWA|nr:hypothetical protein NDU88_006006 [Pleurodeles waltl]